MPVMVETSLSQLALFDFIVTFQWTATTEFYSGALVGSLQARRLPFFSQGCRSVRRGQIAKLGG